MDLKTHLKRCNCAIFLFVFHYSTRVNHSYCNTVKRSHTLLIANKYCLQLALFISYILYSNKYMYDIKYYKTMEIYFDLYYVFGRQLALDIIQ